VDEGVGEFGVAGVEHGILRKWMASSGADALVGMRTESRGCQ
jgi:hypothetical protein